MIEIRCLRCNKLLGKFEGKGEIKCPRINCNMVNKFDTEKKTHYVVKDSNEHVLMGSRKTSSGVTFQ